MTTNDPGAPAAGDDAAPPRRPDPVGELAQAGRALDAPLLAGDEVPPLAPVPQVKPLVWEHVVRPLDGTPAGGLPRIIAFSLSIAHLRVATATSASCSLVVPNSCMWRLATMA